LRAKGYDVLAVSEYMRRSVDSELIEQAFRENRVLLTEDKDFGQVFRLNSERFPRFGKPTLIQIGWTG